MDTRRNPAVVAGLVGVAVLAVPESARALSLSELTEAVFTNPGAAFVAGAVGGALVTGALAGTVALVRGRRHDHVDSFGPVDEAPLPEDASDPARDEAPHGEKPEPPHRPRHLAPGTSFEDDAEGPSRQVAGHAAHDYEQIAENYVRRASFRERMARRAQGVAATLTARMEANMMDGVPVIARADGSVGDVGTSWWDASVGENVSHTSGFAPEDEELAIPSDFSARPTASASEPAAASAAASTPSRASIASRVAFVDEGIYPEHRSDDVQDDEWAQALRSLDERMVEDGPARDPITFIDAAGGADTLDEPDNLEPATAFIPFKTPAGHPEVVDTDSYVDYLISEEFSKNQSGSARRSSRRFLRVLEGGTSSSRRLGDSGSAHRADAPKARAPKHFSVPVAAEA